MKYVDNDVLGSQFRPIHNNIELTTAMQNRKNCHLYTVGTFQVNNQNYIELKERNIKLIGLAFAQLNPSANKQQGKKTVNIIISELSKITLNINVDTNIKKQKGNYISGGMQ